MSIRGDTSILDYTAYRARGKGFGVHLVGVVWDLGPLP